jgi:hypothetical protein
MQPTLSSFQKKNFFFLSLLLLTVLFFILAVLSPTSYGGADDLVHYRFARYSFQYPYLLPLTVQILSQLQNTELHSPK